MKSIIKELIELYKARKEYIKDYRRLEKSNLDYLALQHMVDVVSTKNVVIEIRNGDSVILIRPKSENDNAYKSFMDRYKEQHQV